MKVFIYEVRVLLVGEESATLWGRVSDSLGFACGFCVGRQKGINLRSTDIPTGRFTLEGDPTYAGTELAFEGTYAFSDELGEDEFPVESVKTMIRKAVHDGLKRHRRDRIPLPKNLQLLIRFGKNYVLPGDSPLEPEFEPIPTEVTS